ncbi:MAG: hypothetical protein ACLP2P_05345 [Desulfobaccales bacterium]
MLKFYAYRYLRAITVLDYFTSLAGNEKYNFNEPRCKPALKHLLKTAVTLVDILTEMDLKLSRAKAAELLDHIQYMETVDEVYTQHLNELYSRLDNELKSRVFLVIMPGGREKYYNPKESIFGNDVANKFPELVEDISEASNCFALDRYTACVFHLMRVMEKGAQKFADKVGISPSITYNEEWQTILNAIRGQVSVLYPKHNNPDRIRYESIIAHFETIKIAWRNPTMHPKATYTEEESKALLDAVRIFIKDLVKVL